MSTFEVYLANYIKSSGKDPVHEATMGEGIIAKYYHRDVIKLKSNTVRVRRNSNGSIRNKSHIVRIMLNKCPQFKRYALRLYVADNVELSKPSDISFAVLGQLPKLFIDVEKSTHAEAGAVLKEYPDISTHTRAWVRDALTYGCFRLDEITAIRFEILNNVIDMIAAIRAAFQFLNARADKYFGK